MQIGLDRVRERLGILADDALHRLFKPGYARRRHEAGKKIPGSLIHDGKSFDYRS
jgi:hypothetical protein